MEVTDSFRRVVITGTLICKSDLHIGDGDFGIVSERSDVKLISRTVQAPDQDKNLQKDEILRYNSVCLADSGKAYIPASTLRGSLSADLDTNTDFFKQIFGYATPDTDAGKATRQAGKLRVFDALYIQNSTDNGDVSNLPNSSISRHTFLRYGVSIDPVTGTAKKGRLFCHELVPAKTHFKTTFEADDITATEIKQLVGVIKRWGSAGNTALGAGVTKGLGKIEWNLETVEALTPEVELTWLLDNGDASYTLLPITESVQSCPVEELLSRQFVKPASFTLSVFPDGPFLIHDPGRLVMTGVHNPVLEYMRSGARAIIPSRSLAGVARARAQKILATIAHMHFGVSSEEAVAKIKEPLLDSFFGSEKKRGALWLSAAEGDTEASGHRQYFLGIDRFTGGVNESCNYNVNAANCKKLQIPNCSIDMRRVPAGNWWKGMLIFVLRDAMEGEIQIGWGKSKGYGRVRFSLFCNETESAINDWDGLLARIGRDQAGQWINALFEKIEQIVNPGKREVENE